MTGEEGDILIFIQDFIRSDFLTPVLVFITHTGDYGILWILLSFALIIIPKTRVLGHITAISLLMEAIVTNVIIKNAVARTRPYEIIENLEIIIEKQKDYSFPSGHSGAAFAFSGAMLFALIFGIEGLTSARKYKILTAASLVYSCLLSFSRLYVGVHYPTDVGAGMLLGLLSGFAAFHIEKKIRMLYINFRNSRSL